MDAHTLIAAVCRDAHEAYSAQAHPHKVSLATLRKVAERALTAYQEAPFAGRALLPWVEERIAMFVKGAASDGRATVDKDLLPPGHPARPRPSEDPWAELLSAEERIQALQKSVLDSVNRPGVRKTEDTELVALNRRLSHLFEAHFAGASVQVAPGGIERGRVVKAAAIVHEELERRGLFSPEEPFPREMAKALYDEALSVRTEPEVEVFEGTLSQYAQGVRFELAHADLFLRGRAPVEVLLQKAADRFAPAGSLLHLPMVEPHEAPYEKAFGLAGPHVEIGKVAYTRGAQTSEFTELFTSGALSGVLVVGKESVLLRKSLVPYVLTEAAVQTGWMPPDGESALPPSLEWDVPPELRFWKSACGQDPRVVRDQLVRSGLFTADAVRLVDGLPRRTYEKRFVAPGYDAAPGVFAELQPDALPEAALFRAYADRPIAAAIDKAEQLKHAGELGDDVLAHFDDPSEAVRILEQHRDALLKASRYLLSLPDAPETRRVMKDFGRVFQVPGAPGRVLVASHPLPFEVTYIDDAEIVIADAPVKKGEVALMKQTLEDEEQYVLGIVLEPDVVDSQGDTYDESEVRKTAHTFMARYQNAGLMHKTLVNDSVRIVESFLAPADCEIGGQSVRKGTWLMAMVIDEPELWAQVKAGELTGFSIGGSAIRTPEA